MKKIFIICTVKNTTEEYNNKLYKYVEDLESAGNKVYFPPRDTNQEDNKTGGYKICKDNLFGIMWADEVHISYNEKITEIHFDLGMAFTLNKKIKIFDCTLVDVSLPKSFTEMLRYWENICDNCLNGYSFVGYTFDKCTKCGENFEKNY